MASRKRSNAAKKGAAKRSVRKKVATAKRKVAGAKRSAAAKKRKVARKVGAKKAARTRSR